MGVFMTTASPELVRAPIQEAQREIWFRRVLFAFSVLAGLFLVCHLAIAMWAQNDFTSPESIVNSHATMLVTHGSLYYDLNKYPYTVSAYMPMLYCLEAGMSKLGFSTMIAGRLVSFAALMGIVALTWQMLILYTGNRYCAWTGALLCASTSLLLFWGTVGQVDTLAAFWAIAAFYQYSRYSIRAERTLLWAGVFAGLAFFTKQTSIACPAAIFVLMWFDRPKVAMKFAAGLAAAVLVVVLTINAATEGRFLQDVVKANLNPFSVEKLYAQLSYMVVTLSLMIVIAAGFARVRKGPGRALLLYLALAVLVFLGTSPKIGSDTNYQIELTALLVLSACVALHALDFFRLCFSGTRTWVTLLQIPLALHLVLNFRITTNILLTRVVIEQTVRPLMTAVRPFVAGGGRMLTTDYNAMAHLRGYMEVEALFYIWLVRAGIVDPEPLRRDIAEEKFETILLHNDVLQPDVIGSPMDQAELSALPAAQIQAIREHYKLAVHIPSAYLNGMYVYKPAGKVVR
jgi:Dolichyl-phosphate-mannose-protein mannosyltransferase